MYDAFISEVDKMLDGDRPDWSVLAKYKKTLNGRGAEWVVMAQIAKRAVERNGKKARK